jgi:hypothetical protein
LLPARAGGRRPRAAPAHSAAPARNGRRGNLWCKGNLCCELNQTCDLWVLKLFDLLMWWLSNHVMNTSRLWYFFSRQFSMNGGGTGGGCSPVRGWQSWSMQGTSSYRLFFWKTF